MLRISGYKVEQNPLLTKALGLLFLSYFVFRSAPVWRLQSSLNLEKFNGLSATARLKAASANSFVYRGTSLWRCRQQKLRLEPIGKPWKSKMRIT